MQPKDVDVLDCAPHSHIIFNQYGRFSTKEAGATDVNIQGDYGHGEIVHSGFSHGYDCGHGMCHYRNSTDGSVIAT